MSELQTCPICKKTIEEVYTWSLCPKEDKPVCLDHCFNECEFMDGAIEFCTYRVSREKRT